MKRIYRNSLILLLLMVIVGAIGWGIFMAVSILAGGGLAILNFHWLAGGVDRLLATGDRRRVGGVLVKYIARLVLILLAFFAIFHSSFLSVFGAVAGLSVFVLSGMLEAILLLIKPGSGLGARE